MAQFVAFAIIGGVSAIVVPDATKIAIGMIQKNIMASVTILKTSIQYYSVSKYLNQHIMTHNVFINRIEDIAYGIYHITYILKNTSRVRLSVDYRERYIRLIIYDDLIDIITLPFGNNDEIHLINKGQIMSVIQEIHDLNMSPLIVNIQYIMKDDGQWSNPIMRDRRNISLTPDMALAAASIDEFLKESTRNDYKANGIPYRYGLLLYGESGTGKTTMAEYIAQTKSMDMYCINLISNTLTDSILQQSLVTIDKNSLIVLDEFDKVYPMLSSEKTHITFAGILSALDGAIRLPDGCIVIMMMNGTPDILEPQQKNALIRKGRLDLSFEFKTLLQ